MPKGSKQKLKLYYLSQIMIRKTDDEHFLTMPEIQEELEKYDVSADRKSLYDDLEALRVLGIDIIGEKVGRSYGYHVGTKQFDIAELKLLVDAVQSSKFISERKSNDLIKKITGIASEYEAQQLKRQVVVQGRVKSMNESVLYGIDSLHRSIAERKQIRFEYMQWNIEKKMERKREGFYGISPWALTWDNENYYLIAYDAAAAKIKHYRVDKMRNITVLDKKCEGWEAFREFNLAEYSKMNFSMFSGEKTKVTLEFKNSYVGVLLDRFGKDIPIRPAKREGWSQTNVDVAMSDQFLGWIFALGSGVRITKPDSVVERFIHELDEMMDLYES